MDILRGTTICHGFDAAQPAPQSGVTVQLSEYSYHYYPERNKMLSAATVPRTGPAFPGENTGHTGHRERLMDAY